MPLKSTLIATLLAFVLALSALSAGHHGVFTISAASDTPSEFAQRALAGSTTEVFRSVLNGSYASVHQWESTLDGYTRVEVIVSRSGSGQERSTSLIYWRQQCNFVDENWTCAYDSGAGLIPNEHLALNGQKVRLTTNTAAITHGYSMLTGNITLEWEPIRDNYVDRHFNERHQFGPFRVHRVGREELNAAVVRGTLLGISLSNGYGMVGQQHGSSLILSK